MGPTESPFELAVRLWHCPLPTDKSHIELIGAWET